MAPRREDPPADAGAKADAAKTRRTDAAPPPLPVPAGRDSSSKLRALVDATLAHASSLTRSDGPEGTERWVPRAVRERAELALSRLPPQAASTLTDLLTGLDTARKRGLLLRVLAARASRADNPSTMAVLIRFAERLRVLSDEEVTRRATVSDLDSRTNDAPFDSATLGERRGTIRDPTTVNRRADNDGLFQRFTGSCGPTTVQILLAEADPVVAFAIHEAGLTSASSHDEVARFQRELLSDFGEDIVGREEALLRARLRNALGRLDDDGHASAVRRYALQGGERTPEAEAGLTTLRARFDGFPSDDELTALRREILPRRDFGTSTDQFVTWLDRVLTPVNGVRYQAVGPEYGFARGQAWRYLDDVARTLRRGVDVPFGIAEPGHWMAMTAVKGRKPRRSFLVVDPWSARTAWVSERSFVRGTFIAEHFFEPSYRHHRPFVDVIFLPA